MTKLPTAIKSFKPGDIVQLKSGSPSMTISLITKIEDLTNRAVVLGYVCVYYSKEQGKIATEIFPEYVLKRVGQVSKNN